MADNNLAGTTPISLISGAAFLANVGLKLSSGTVIECAAEGDMCIGISLDASTAAGQPVRIQQYGIASCVSNGTVAQDAQVECGADGKVTTAAGAAARTIGVALDAAGADLDLVRVLLMLSGNGPANQ